MRPDQIPLKDLQALLGEKDIVIYVLSVNNAELCDENVKLKEQIEELKIELEKANGRLE